LAARPRVPHVSAMSSTRIAIFPFTEPTRTIRETSLAFFRSLWKRAKSTLRRSAMDVALYVSFAITQANRVSYRLAPPASGETMTQFSTSIRSRICLTMAGSAYSYSLACITNLHSRVETYVIDRNIKESLNLRCVQIHCLTISLAFVEQVKLTMTWSHPASLSMLATNFAVIGARDLSFLS